MVIKENIATKFDIFDRKLLLKNNNRYQGFFEDYNFLYLKIANLILENIHLQNRTFDSVFEINKKTDFFKNNIASKTYEASSLQDIIIEENINFPPQKFDLIISNLDLHFINQVPLFLFKIKQALKAQGFFIASFFGDENLPELRKSLFDAENEVRGGISPRMPPTIDIKTAGQILAQVGFKNAVADLEKITIEYSNPLMLLKDLKYSAQGNIMLKRSQSFFSKKLLEKLLKRYDDFYDKKNQNYPATFFVITVSGSV